MGTHMYNDCLVVTEVGSQPQHYCFDLCLRHEILLEENSPRSLTSIDRVHSTGNKYLGRIPVPLAGP